MTSPHPSIGQTLGHYRILERIGQGGMGVVYRARDERLDRDVALKVLPAGALAGESARRLFRKEGLALAKLNHPNIAAVYDFDSQDGVDFLALEYIPGESLAARLRAGSLGEKEIGTLGGQIAGALEEAHEQGIIHRDLKPGNVMVTPKGQAKVLDFGLAKLLRSQGDAEVTQSFTETHGVAGTLPYMAPEQLRGETADARTDIYSLGCVLYEMATGQRPFQGDSAPQLTDAILHRPPVTPRAVNVRISPALEHIIVKCLEKEAENRYQSAKEVTVDLRRMSTPSAVTAAIAPRPAAEGWRRYALPVVAVLVLLLAGVTIALNVGGWRTRILGRDESTQIHSLAVLPLENISGDASQDYFSEGMTEELTNELASLRSIDVIARNSANRYRKSPKTQREIAGELNVDALVGGSVRRSGEQVRIAVELIEGTTEKVLWSKSYDRKANDVLGLQREVARTIANEIHLTLTPVEKLRLASPMTQNQQAYEAFLRAKYHLESALHSRADTDAAIAQAEQAISFDPNFAEAHVALAAGSAIRIFAWAGGKEFDEKAFVALGRALALNPNLASAYVVRGNLYYNRLHNFDIASAVADYRRALALNPNLADAHQHLGSELTHFGLHDKAIEEFRTTLRLDPQNDGAKMRLGRALWQSGRFAEALEHYERHNFAGFEKALTLAYLGRRQQAWETVEEITQRLGDARRGTFADREDIAAVRAFLYATEGRPTQAEQQVKISASLGKDDDHFHHAGFILAAACAEMGKAHEAVAWLKIVADGGMPNYPLFHDNPSMLKLRGNPQYEQFIAELKVRWDHLAPTL
jgi:serine/threonine-protein kinase